MINFNQNPSSTIQWICKRDRKFNKLKNHYKIKARGMRGINDNGQLNLIFYRIAKSPTLVSKRMKLVIMVTASHNPSEYNGIKIGTPAPDIMPNYPDISEVVNQRQQFQKFVKENFKNKKQIKNPHTGVFIGMDKRPSSPELVNILEQTFKTLGIKVFNLGFKSTPQLFIISSFYVKQQKIRQIDNTIKNHSCQSNIQYALRIYYENSLEHFQRTLLNLYRICGVSPKNTKPTKIQLDFSNGVGALSYKNYQSLILRYFVVNCVASQNFEHVNNKVGAEYATNNVQKLFNNQYDRQVYFDGDCDRIVLITQGQLKDGNDFGALFTFTIVTIIKQIEQKNYDYQLNQKLKALKMGLVGSINSNTSLKEFAINLGISYEQASVGSINLYMQTIKYDIGCYFEPCGHGNLYFSETAIQLLKNISKKVQETKIEVQILQSFAQLSQNSSNGHALHNWLIEQLCVLYCESILGVSWCKLFSKQYSISINFLVKQISKFCNQSNTLQLVLQQPKSLVQFAQTLRLKYHNCKIVIRKSQTEPLIRLHLQGDIKDCENIQNQFYQEFYHKYGLISSYTDKQSQSKDKQSKGKE